MRDVLNTLKASDATGKLAILANTNLGRTVYKLTKYDESTIAALASSLVQTWRALRRNPGYCPLLWLDNDALRELFQHVELPFALKLTCRALRAAAPKRTENVKSKVVASIKLLQWARANGYKLGEWTCWAAAGGGHLAVLKWARANGCPWNKEGCAYSAKHGHEDDDEHRPDRATIRWIATQA